VDLKEIPLAVRFVTPFVPSLSIVRRRHVPATREEQPIHGPHVLRDQSGIAIRHREDDGQTAGRADGSGIGVADRCPPLQAVRIVAKPGGDPNSRSHLLYSRHKANEKLTTDN
jgi:hypothetical protein